MTVTAILPANGDTRSELARWSASAVVVLAAHIGIIAGYWLLRPLQPQGSEDAPAVIIDLAPFMVAPSIQKQDLAPGPDTPTSEPEEVEKPKHEATESPKIEPAPTVRPLVTLPEARPKAVEKPKESSPAPPVQTAPPKAEHTAPAPAAARLGSNTANYVQLSWIRQLLAHLNRFKQYPPTARSRREEGVVTLSFTMDREGHILARHVAKGSGSSALDAEALEMLQRAEPLPAFPSDMLGESRSFSVPIRFSLH